MIGEHSMKTMYDVRQLLKKFGVFVYTGSRHGDLLMITDEINGLYQLGLINVNDYQIARLIIKREEAMLNQDNK